MWGGAAFWGLFLYSLERCMRADSWYVVLGRPNEKHAGKHGNIMYKNAVRTSQRTRSVSLWNMKGRTFKYCLGKCQLFTVTLCGKNAKFCMLKQVVHMVTTVLWGGRYNAFNTCVVTRWKSISCTGPFIDTGMRSRCPLQRIRGLQLHCRSGLPTLWHAYPEWHGERFPWHAAFTAVPIFFISFATLASLYCAAHVHMHTACTAYRLYKNCHCYQITLQGNIFTQIGAVRSVDWIFIVGAPAWRWPGEYGTLGRTFYSLLLKQEVVTATFSANCTLSHSARRTLLEIR